MNNGVTVFKKICRIFTERVNSVVEKLKKKRLISIFVFVILFLICTSTLSGRIDNCLYPTSYGLYGFIQFHIFRVQN